MKAVPAVLAQHQAEAMVVVILCEPIFAVFCLTSTVPLLDICKAFFMSAAADLVAASCRASERECISLEPLFSLSDHGAACCKADICILKNKGNTPQGKKNGNLQQKSSWPLGCLDHKATIILRAS